MRIARALSASLLFFSPLFQGFLVFLFFRALLKKKHKIDDVAGSPALFFVPG